MNAGRRPGWTAARRPPAISLCLAVLLLTACARDPAADLPQGTLWAGEAAAARALLAGLEHFTGSPAALGARRLEERLAGCERFLAYCPAGEACSLAARLSCEPAGELARAADAVRRDAAWVFSRRGNGQRLTAWGEVEPGGALSMRARLATAREGRPEPWQALLPARRAPAPPVLAGAGALVRLRLRSQHGAAAFAGLASAERAEELFSLRGEAFARMALEGTSELVLFPSAPGELIPPLALALHVRLRDTAVRGMEDLLADVRARWPVTRAPWQLGEHSGACLTDLNVLPELAPCYVSTERALVIGWNQRSVRLALEAPAPTQEPSASELVLDLARLPETDRRLRQSFGGPQTAGAAAAYPWSRLTAAGARQRGGYDLTLRLNPPAAAGSPGG